MQYHTRFSIVQNLSHQFDTYWLIFYLNDLVRGKWSPDEDSRHRPINIIIMGYWAWIIWQKSRKICLSFCLPQAVVRENYWGITRTSTTRIANMMIFTLNFYSLWWVDIKLRSRKLWFIHFRGKREHTCISILVVNRNQSTSVCKSGRKSVTLCREINIILILW